MTTAVRPGVPVRLRAVWMAWQRARRGKQPSQNQLRFEARWLDRLQQLTTTLRAGAWQPAATVAFVVRHPKTREIHAPDFADRVVHHLLVERLQTFLRQRENMPGQLPAGLPSHKRLCHAPPGRGVPVGNLTSQFFANVYLNELDQRLGLSLRAGAVLQPCCQGVDFLGYRVFAHRRWVRPRVVRHCRAKLTQWRVQHPAGVEHLSAAGFASLQALLGSYWGHFAHAHSVRLRQRLWAEFPWLAEGFELLPDGRLRVSQPARWRVWRHRRVHQILRITRGADSFNPFDEQGA